MPRLNLRLGGRNIPIRIAPPSGGGPSIAPSFSGGLDNSMTSVPVGTATASGLSGTITWSIDVQDDECQTATLFGGAPNPRYTIASGQGTATIAITANYLSAQTDTILLSASGTGGTANASAPLTVAAKVGPAATVNASNAESGSNYHSWDHALDAYWTDPVSNAGMSITMVSQDISADFDRLTIGHGSNEQWYPGPATLKGTSASSPLVLDFQGTARGTGQGCLYAQGGDIIFQDIEVRNGTNIYEAEGNVGAFYKTSQLPYNLSMVGCKSYNNDNGFLAGSPGQRLRMYQCTFAMCGTGAGGLTHNAYCGQFTHIDVDSCLSFGTMQVHEFKTRAIRGSFTNCIFADGENGVPGGSGIIDIPDGGDYTVSGCTFMKGPNPNNNNNMLQFCAEAGDGSVNLWPVNNLAVDGCYFLNLVPPGQTFGETFAVKIFGDGSNPTVSPTTGLPATATVTNSFFYNFSASSRFIHDKPANTVTDGGGNAMITQIPSGVLSALTNPLDPRTGSPLDTSHMNPSYAIPNRPTLSPEGITTTLPGILLAIAVNATIGTAVTTVTAWDSSGVVLAGVSYSLADSSGGKFAINSSTGTITVANGSIADSLLWITAQATGTDYASASKTYTHTLAIVVGSGTVTNRA